MTTHQIEQTAPPVADRAQLAEALTDLERLMTASDGTRRWCLAGDAAHVVDVLIAAGVLRREDDVKGALAERIARRSQELIGGFPGGAAADIARKAAGEANTAAFTRLIKVEAIREAEAAQRALAAASSTRDGRYEHETLADWLDEHARSL